MLVLTADRRLIEFREDANLRAFLAASHFVTAKDGVLVPVCDLKQYEYGKRPAREFIVARYRPAQMGAQLAEVFRHLG